MALIIGLCGAPSRKLFRGVSDRGPAKAESHEYVSFVNGDRQVRGEPISIRGTHNREMPILSDHT